MNENSDAKPFDYQGLHDFIVARDRILNPVFVGREDAIERIDDCLELIRTRRHEPGTGTPSAKGLMQLIQGPPGVGKTSLLDTMTDRYIDRLADGGIPHKVIPIVISNTRTLSVDHVNREMQNGMIRVLDRIGNEDVRVFVRKLFSIVRDIDFFGLRLGRSDTREASLPRLPKNCTILLMIDEIQTATSDLDAAAAVLQHLEAGSNGQAIMPVLAGLANSSDHLERLGLSRQADDSITYLKPLLPSEIVAATHRFITAFGIQSMPATRQLWARTLWRWSKGWPKHLQNGLSVLATQLLNTQGDLVAVDLMTAQRMERAKRIQYYWTRFGDEQRRNPALLGNVMARLGRDPVSARRVEAAIRDTMQMGVWDDTPAPEWDDMLRRGLIDIERIQARGSTYACPIPSLHSFAVTCTGPPLHAAVLDSDIDAIANGTDADINVNGQDAWARTALHIAAQEDCPDMVVALLGAGASIEAADQWGQTSLHHAAHENAEHALMALLNHGANVHACDQRGETPLHHAARTDSAYALQQLLDAHTNPRARNRFGKTARDLAPPSSNSRRLLDGIAPDEDGSGGMDES